MNEAMYQPNWGALFDPIMQRADQQAMQSQQAWDQLQAQDQQTQQRRRRRRQGFMDFLAMITGHGPQQPQIPVGVARQLSMPFAGRAPNGA